MQITRRSPQNYIEMGTPLDSKLELSREGETYMVEVCDSKKVSHSAWKIILTVITKELLGIERVLQPTSYWTYNEKNLMDIYNKTYVSSDE